MAFKMHLYVDYVFTNDLDLGVRLASTSSRGDHWSF